MRRRTARSWTAALLALVMLLGLSACGGKGEDISKKDPKQVMTEAGEKLAAAKSISFKLDMEMAFATQGETIDLSMYMAVDTIKEPLQIRANTHMGMFDMDVVVYTIKEGDDIVAYTGAENEGKMEWYKTTLTATEMEEQTAAYNAEDSFSAQLELAENLKMVGTETIAGKKAIRYDGVIPGAEIGKAMDATGGEDTLDLLGIDLSKLDQDVPISIWIYEDGMPARYAFDMTDLMGQMMGESDYAAGIQITDMRVDMTITGVDEITEITLPPEALAAEEMDLNEYVG
ncbi:MAG: hypothetical protein E7426_04355 [Ruminococcaceae bacterium]|jgi:hypothetical protein|nr:hypothetical protein [Oscillospiraceae bacterium]